MPPIDPAVLNRSAYKAITPRPTTNPAQAGPNGGLSGFPRGKQVSLRQLAKQVNATHPLTYLGELLSADSLVSVARQAGFDAKALTRKSSDYLATLFKLIDSNHPAIVAFDVDQDIHTTGKEKWVLGPNHGCPGKFGGENAHWAVVVAYQWGIFWDDVVIFHWEKYFKFPAKRLRDSAAQLIRFSSQTWGKVLDPASRTTTRGNHWQKLESQTPGKPRHRGAQGIPAWDTKNNHPGPYALSTESDGQIVKTVFNNTNLNLRNVIIEVVPQETPFA
jgi:hypothetical protein